MSVTDLLTVSYDEADDTYMIYNSIGSLAWTGVHSDVNIAIMLYLQRRLGIAGKDKGSDA